MITRGRTGMVVAVLAVLVLAGCADGEEPPKVTSTVTVTPSPSRSLSPSPSPAPTLPPEAQQPTRPGAEAFARYFFAVYNYAFWNADPAPLQAISDSGCVYCNSTLDRVRSVRAKRTRVVGGELRVTTAVATPGDGADGFLVNLVLLQEEGQTYSPGGDVLGSSPRVANARMDVAVGWSGNRWLLLDGHILKPGES